MKLNDELFDKLKAQALASPRLRMNYDLRNSDRDQSQRMLNAMEPGTAVPVHRHRSTTEVVAVLRGRLRQNFYDDSGVLTESFEAGPGTPTPAFVVEAGRWHNSEALTSGTVIFESKEGAFAPLATEDVLTQKA